jgi:hypothetical protein
MVGAHKNEAEYSFSIGVNSHLACVFTITITFILIKIHPPIGVFSKIEIIRLGKCEKSHGKEPGRKELARLPPWSAKRARLEGDEHFITA